MASELRVDRIVPVDGVPNNGGGGVVQVVQASTNTQLIVNTTTWTDTTLSATITPKFSTSKILMITNHSVFGVSTGTNDNLFWGIRYLRDATVIFDPQANTTGPYEFGTNLNTLTGARYWYDRCIPPELLDSPNTTSAVTYKTQCRSYDPVNAAGDIRFQYNGGSIDGLSYITLMEISA